MIVLLGKRRSLALLHEWIQSQGDWTLLISFKIRLLAYRLILTIIISHNELVFTNGKDLDDSRLEERCYRRLYFIGGLYVSEEESDHACSYVL